MEVLSRLFGCHPTCCAEGATEGDVVVASLKASVGLSLGGLPGPPEKLQPMTRTNVTVAALDDNGALQIMLFLDTRSSIYVQATSASNVLASASSLPSLWAEHTRRTFGLGDQCIGPMGEQCDGNWKSVFALWQCAANDLNLGDMASGIAFALPPPRWIAIWARMRRWLRKHAPEVAASLRTALPGAFPGTLLSDPNDPNSLPIADASPTVLGMWRVFDGQHVEPCNPANPWTHGIFGGYSPYDHKTSTVLLPLVSGLAFTSLMRRNLSIKDQLATKIVFACAYDLKKILLVDLCDGSVYAFTPEGDSWFELLVPPASADLADGLARWFELYVDRLEAGTSHLSA